MRLAATLLTVTLLLSTSSAFAASGRTMKITAPIKGSCITSGYGHRRAPTAGASSFHQAVDLRAACGTQVVAAADGVVSFAGWYRGYGNQLRIRHADGTETRYSHLSKITVRPGAHVGEGNPVAKSGHSTSLKHGVPCHLHFEILAKNRFGKYGKINPEPFVRAKWCAGKRRSTGGGQFLTR